MNTYKITFVKSQSFAEVIVKANGFAIRDGLVVFYCENISQEVAMFPALEVSVVKLDE